MSENTTEESRDLKAEIIFIIVLAIFFTITVIMCLIDKNALSEESLKNIK